MYKLFLSIRSLSYKTRRVMAFNYTVEIFNIIFLFRVFCHIEGKKSNFDMGKPQRTTWQLPHLLLSLPTFGTSKYEF